MYYLTLSYQRDRSKNTIANTKQVSYIPGEFFCQASLKVKTNT